MSSHRSAKGASAGRRRTRPVFENLEGRLLLYGLTGTGWTQPRRITYSFVPDGTSIGGVPSNLQATLNARFSPLEWKLQFARAFAVWQRVANVNFSLVADDGSAIGVPGNQQSDPRFGDIRIGGFTQAANQLGFAYLPPPANGGTNAGDIFFNTMQSWQINGTTYDLMTVAVHEIGHSLGLGHSSISTASMYAVYNNAKQGVATDDANGIRTIYNSRQNDFFDANGANNSSTTSDDVSSYLDAQGQLTLSALDSTTPLMIGTNDLDWFRVRVPSGTSGRMVVRMQSTGLSLLSPMVSVFNGGGTTLLAGQSSDVHGDTVSVTIDGVVPGQVYLIRARGTTSGDSGFGSYGLQVNFGSAVQPPVTAPNTFAAQQADIGGGTLSQTNDEDAATDEGQWAEEDAGPQYWIYEESDALVEDPDPTPDGGFEVDGDGDGDHEHEHEHEEFQIGDLSGLGDALEIDPAMLREVAAARGEEAARSRALGFVAVRAADPNTRVVLALPTLGFGGPDLLSTTTELAGASGRRRQAARTS